MSEQHDTLLAAQQSIDPDTPAQQVALEQAAAWFEQYAENHTAKGTPDGDAKAKTNRERAEYLRSALRSPAATSLPDGVERGCGHSSLAPDAHATITLTPAPAQPEAAGDVVEAVAWQSRERPNWRPEEEWGPWKTCSSGTFADIQKNPTNGDWHYQSRALYAHPSQAKLDGMEEAAKVKYRDETDNHPTIHTNRFLTWDELSEDAKEPYRALAQQEQS